MGYLTTAMDADAQAQLVSAGFCALWSVLPPALSSMRSRRLQACYPSRSTV
ncbi:MAG: hypothetical protein ACLRM9_05390 [Collinsella aerofaciens]